MRFSDFKDDKSRFDSWREFLTEGHDCASHEGQTHEEWKKSQLEEVYVDPDDPSQDDDLNELMRLIREEIEVVLSDAEAKEFFGDDALMQEGSLGGAADGGKNYSLGPYSKPTEYRPVGMAILDVDFSNLKDVGENMPGGVDPKVIEDIIHTAFEDAFGVHAGSNVAKVTVNDRGGGGYRDPSNSKYRVALQFADRDEYDDFESGWPAWGAGEGGLAAVMVLINDAVKQYEEELRQYELPFPKDELQEEKSGKCPPDGCVQKREKGWVVISNKTGQCWGRSKQGADADCTYYDSREKAEAALDAYHAGGGWERKKDEEESIKGSAQAGH